MKKLLITSAILLSLSAFSQGPHCKGTKKDNTPCKSVIINKAGYCQFHDPNAKHCTFIKKDKTRCKMTAKDGLCRFHKD